MRQFSGFMEVIVSCAAGGCEMDSAWPGETQSCWKPSPADLEGRLGGTPQAALRLCHCCGPCSHSGSVHPATASKTQLWCVSLSLMARFPFSSLSYKSPVTSWISSLRYDSEIEANHSPGWASPRPVQPQTASMHFEWNIKESVVCICDVFTSPVSIGDFCKIKVTEWQSSTASCLCFHWRLFCIWALILESLNKNNHNSHKSGKVF